MVGLQKIHPRMVYTSSSSSSIPGTRKKSIVFNIVFVVVTAGILSTIAAFFYHPLSSYFTLTLGRTLRLKQKDSLLFITLSYDAAPNLEGKRTKCQPFILNNCLLVKNAGHQMRIYTDDMDQDYCHYCDCRRFEPYQCACPRKNCTGVRNICEKNHLYSDLLVEQGPDGFVFLDFDLVIVKPEAFFPELVARSQHVDFLATRAHGTYRAEAGPIKYLEDFNSGLVFMRAIPGVDPMMLRDILYEEQRIGRETLYDQSILSRFVHRHYPTTRWDELSIKWHCRMIGSIIYKDMPLEACYTVHDPDLLKALNYTLVNSTKKAMITSII